MPDREPSQDLEPHDEGARTGKGTRKRKAARGQLFEELSADAAGESVRVVSVEDDASLAWDDIGLGSLLEADDSRASASKFMEEMLREGAQVGGFTLRKLLGKGGMGEVWLAHEETGALVREVAVKFIRPDCIDDLTRQLFANEVRAGGRLGYHDGLLTVLTCGRVPTPTGQSVAWFSMPYIEGVRSMGDLLNEVRDEERLDKTYYTRIAELFEKLAHAMQGVHDHGVIHRDLKPANVLLTQADEPKVADFGLAQIIDTPGHALGRVGTVFYMSPEHVTDKVSSSLSDQFSLGAMLYEFLALARPFTGGSVTQVLGRIERAEPIDPRKLRRGVPRDLAVICARAMARKPEDRYASMAELAADLRRYLDDQPIKARPQPLWVVARKWIWRHPAIASALFLTTLGLAVTGSLYAKNVIVTRGLQRLATGADITNKIKEAESSLWPVEPQKLEGYGEWLEGMEGLVATRPLFQRELEDLRARAKPLSLDEESAMIDAHPLAGELEIARSRLASLERADDIRSGRQAFEPPTVERSAFRSNSLIASDVNPLVIFDRREFGREAEGLALMLEVVDDLGPTENAVWPYYVLARAYLANGLDEDALDSLEVALDAATTTEDRAEITRAIKEFETAIAEASGELGRQRTAVAELEAAVRERSVWEFDDIHDTWWHGQLETLLPRLDQVSDPEIGLVSGISTEYGWGVERRREFALQLAAREAELEKRWKLALSSISDARECPAYAGLGRLKPVPGLYPLQKNPRTNLWEFCHLQSGAVPELRDGEPELTPETGIVLVLLPGGRTQVGAQKADPEGIHYDPKALRDEPLDEVWLAPFMISKYEVTQAQWERATGASPSKNQWVPFEEDTRLHPMEAATWTECSRVAGWWGLQVPTEAQWEYAARAGNTRPNVGWGEPGFMGSFNMRDSAKDGWHDGLKGHTVVTNYAPNAFGLYQVEGNVWEWCRDVYDKDAYFQTPLEDPLRDLLPGDDPDEAKRVIRGGGYGSKFTDARLANRFWFSPNSHDPDLGLRPVLELPRTEEP